MLLPKFQVPPRSRSMTRAHVDSCELTRAHSKLFVPTVCFMRHRSACNRDADSRICQTIPRDIALPPNEIFPQRIRAREIPRISLILSSSVMRKRQSSRRSRRRILSLEWFVSRWHRTQILTNSPSIEGVYSEKSSYGEHPFCSCQAVGKERHPYVQS